MKPRSYFMALVRRGTTLVLQLADSKDQIHCEAIKIYGERVNTITNLRRKQGKLAAALRGQGFRFKKFTIERVRAGDFSAGA